MNFKRTIFPVIVIGATVTAGVTGAYFAGAQETDPIGSLSQKIARTFSLKQEDVDKVFDQHRDEKFASRMKYFEDRLDKAVSEKKITEEQKNLILAKKREMHAQHEGEMRDFTPQQRKEKKAERHAQWESWAKDNGIDSSLLMGGFGKGGHGKHGGCSAGTETL